MKTVVLNLIVAFVVSCAHMRPDPNCFSTCGLETHVETTQECQDLSTIEGEILRSYKKNVKGFSESQACLQLRGWEVRRHVRGPGEVCPEPAWNEGGIYGWTPPLCVVGYTHRDERMVEIENRLSWKSSSLTHELGHVMLGTGHCRWTEQGIKKAIHDVTGEEDTTPEYCF